MPALVGVLPGVINASFLDLFMRVCPHGLEGAAMLFGGAVASAAFAGTDIFGATLYEKGGFALALLISALCTAMILPLLLAVPRNLVATRDGEHAVATATDA